MTALSLAIEKHRVAVTSLAIAMEHLAAAVQRSNDIGETNAKRPHKPPEMPPEIREIAEGMGLLKPKVKIEVKG